MDAALRPYTATGHPVLRQSEPSPGGAVRAAIQTSVAVLVGALVISVLMLASILLVGPATLSNPGPMPEPVPQPSAAAGLDL